MKSELLNGHFEHTIRELSNGTELTYNDVVKGVERLTTKGLIAFRKRGSNKKPIPYYYLSELRERFGDKEKRSENRKRNIDLKAKEVESEMGGER
jgi:predicted transcriptional regulator